MSKYQSEATWLYLFIGLFLLLLGYTVYNQVAKSKEVIMASNRTVDETNGQSALTLAFEKERDSLKRQIDILQNTPQPIVGGHITDEGLHYEVQIGAFKYFNLKKYQQAFDHLKGEAADGYDKYTLAKFRNYTEAEEFKKDIQHMGIKDAFIVPKLDGKRIDIKQALKAENKK